MIGSVTASKTLAINITEAMVVKVKPKFFA